MTPTHIYLYTNRNPMRITALALLVALTACGATQTATTATASETDRTAVPGSSLSSTGGLRMDARPTARMDTLWVPLDRIWKVLPAVYGLLDIPIEHFNAESNEIGHSSLKLFRKLGETQLTKLLDCGNTQIGPNADSYEVYLTVLTKLTKAKVDTTATTVATIVSGRAKPVQFNGGFVTCKSKGQLEARIAEVLKVNLQ
jgi:hypothetical protein